MKDDAANRTSPSLTRIRGYDVARCLAILAMVYVNYEVALASGVDTPRWLRGLASLLEGRAAALFVILAGIGFTLLDNRRVLLRRSLFLLVVGYLWQLVWPGDILHFYAFFLLAGALCLRLEPRWLFLLALASAGVFVALFFTLDYGAGWNWITLEYPAFWTLAGQVRNLFFNGWHPLFPWTAFVFLGMALGRLTLHAKNRRRIVCAIALAVFAAAETASYFLSRIEDRRSFLEQLSKWFQAPDAIFGTASIPPMPLYLLSAAGTAVALICLTLEAADRPWARRAVTPLVSCGQLALTLYVAHVLVGLYDADKPHGPAALQIAALRALFFGLGALLLCHLWRMRFRYGPLEWLMRKVSA
jgi:uncharacterized membrane protein YeiB